MELEQQLNDEIQELEQLITTGQQQGDPKHLLKMYQSLLRNKREKLKQLEIFSE